ncbi:ABC transporter ATP-binding protein [Paenibacillus sp. BK720]|uniref:ABC transporter ATP-binding protein n=1 Tax=Paenibacillus sp. BK720 TaxID=2587092 RepID=UPI0014248F73|nr:ABC transporter ATP-binding protein [Paenibacillus sp. BK720]NIK72477.1 ATP-binding cassette subfamily B protein [Paenibacillus sp. BK720]
MDLNISRRNSEVIRNLFVHILPLLWQTAPRLLIVSIFMRIVQATVPTAQILLTKEMIDEAARLIGKQAGSVIPMLLWVGLQAVLFAVDLSCLSLGKLLIAKTQLKANYELEKMIARKCSRLSLIHYDQPAYYDQLQRVTQGMAYRGLHIVENFFSLLQNMLTISTYLILLSSLHYSLAGGMLLLIIPSLIVNLKMGHKKFAQIMMQTPTVRKVEYFMKLMTGKEASKELRIFRLFPYLQMRWSSLYWQNGNEKIVLEKQILQTNFLTDMSTHLVTLCSTTILVIIAMQGHLTLGFFVALTQALSSTQHSIMIIAFHLSQVFEESLFISELFDFLNRPEPVEQQRNSVAFPLQKGITVDKLSFRFPNSHQPVLKNISFHIRPGQKVAIVGNNGAGKSTLIKCLLGLYEPENGAVLYDGVNVMEIDGIEKHISAVFQDFVNYQLSAKENIGFGNIDQMDDLSQIEIAANKSGANAFIQVLPERFETLLGREFMDSHELSFGQWQKIALSRAFFKKADIIVLDEPTAALDPIAEALLFERFSQLAEGNTTFMISHRLGSCRDADVILVLSNGELVEHGNHDVLMSLQGTYAQMFNLQAKWYEKAG